MRRQVNPYFESCDFNVTPQNLCPKYKENKKSLKNIDFEIMGIFEKDGLYLIKNSHVCFKKELA